MVGELVGARLIAHAGSLISLAKHPASTVQILGTHSVPNLISQMLASRRCCVLCCAVLCCAVVWCVRRCGEGLVSCAEDEARHAQVRSDLPRVTGRSGATEAK